MNVYMNGQEKGDCLINVTSWEGLSACRIALYIYIHIHNIYILTICLLYCLFCPFSDLHITTNVERSNPSHGEVYLIQHDVIKFVSDLPQVVGFLRVHRFLLPIQLTTTI